MIHYPNTISINFLAKSIKIVCDDSQQDVLNWLGKNPDITYRHSPIMGTFWLYPQSATDLNSFAWDLDEALNQD